MKLTRASSYALHAIAYMAAQKHDRPIASHEIARARGIPERFLLKVLKPLASAGVLQSVKGPNGGYRLAKPATQVSMLEIVEAVDGQIRGLVSFSHGNGASGIDSRLETICKQNADHLRKQLQKVRISDLAAKR